MWLTKASEENLNAAGQDVSGKLQAGVEIKFLLESRDSWSFKWGEKQRCLCYVVMSWNMTNQLISNICIWEVLN